MKTKISHQLAVRLLRRAMESGDATKKASTERIWNDQKLFSEFLVQCHKKVQGDTEKA